MKKIRIGLLTANLNNGNMGCNALTYSAISLLQQVAAEMGVEFEYILFGGSRWVPELYPEFQALNIEAYVPVVTAKEKIKKLIQRRPLEILKYGRALKSCDCFFEIAGGDSFSDIYGIQRPRDFNAAHRKIAKKGSPLVFLPQTIGPFKSSGAKRIAKNSLSGARHIFARDPISYQLAAEYTGAARLTQTIDMAFFMDYRPRAKNGGKPQIGINPSGLLWNGGYTGRNQFGLKESYPDLLRGIIESIDSAVYDIVLVAHVLHGPVYNVEDDYRICRQLKKEYPHCGIAPFFYTPVEAKSFISGMDLLIGSRMHCCIAAYSSGVPVYPLAYSRKFKGLFKEELGYPCGAELHEDSRNQILAGLRDVLDRLPEIQSEMPERLARVEVYGAAFKEELAALMKSILQQRNCR